MAENEKLPSRNTHAHLPQLISHKSVIRCLPHSPIYPATVSAPSCLSTPPDCLHTCSLFLVSHTTFVLSFVGLSSYKWPLFKDPGLKSFISIRGKSLCLVTGEQETTTNKERRQTNPSIPSIHPSSSPLVLVRVARVLELIPAVTGWVLSSPAMCRWATSSYALIVWCCACLLLTSAYSLTSPPLYLPLTCLYLHDVWESYNRLVGVTSVRLSFYHWLWADYGLVSNLCYKCFSI